MVFEKIAEMIAEKMDCEVSAVTADSKFNEMGIDSLDFMEMLMQLEEEFGIEIDMGEEKLETVGQLVALIEAKQA